MKTEIAKYLRLTKSKKVLQSNQKSSPVIPRAKGS